MHAQILVFFCLKHKSPQHSIISVEFDNVIKKCSAQITLGKRTNKYNIKIIQDKNANISID